VVADEAQEPSGMDWRFADAALPEPVDDRRR
jgi:hypothetical protein